MESLANRHCVPCRGDTPPIPEAEIPGLLEELEGWELDAGKLVKSFRFHNFLEAVDFVNRITPVAEAEGHHPNLEVSWGRVKVRLWTHAIGGLSDNDFILAAKIERTLAPR